MLNHPDNQATDQVDQRDDDSSNSITLHKLAGTVHSPVKIGFPLDILAARTGLSVRNQTRVQIGVYCHLLTRHGVQRKSGCHFRYTGGPFGDNDKLDHYQDEKDDEPDNHIAPDHKLSERSDHLSFKLAAQQENKAGGGNIQSQSEQCHNQKQRGKHRKFQCSWHIHGEHEYDEGDHKIERQKEIEQRSRHRYDHHDHDGYYADDDQDIAVLQDIRHRNHVGHLLFLPTTFSLGRTSLPGSSCLSRLFNKLACCEHRCAPPCHRDGKS